MKYSFTSRIRYSETDKNMKLTFPAMMDYFQDTSTFHGEDNGLPLDLLYSKNLAWVLSGWQVRIFKHLGLNDIATFTTWAYNFRHCIGLRNYTLRDNSGTLCAVADTQYVLMDMEKQLPTRITQFLADGYTLEPEAHISVDMPRKIADAKNETALELLPVKEYMIDTNNHVNNSQYIKLSMSYLPKDMEFNCFRAEYKRQARLGDVFYPYRSELENGIQIKLCDADHDEYFIAEWTFDPTQTGDKYDPDR